MSPPTATSVTGSHPPVWAGLLLIAALLLAIASTTTLWDRDEPRNARASVEMWGSGDWLVPHFNGELRPHKPPLYYWLAAPVVGALGVGSLAVRLPSVVAMVGLCGLTFLIGRRMFGGRAGWWAMMMLGTCGMGFWVGTTALQDAVLALFCTAALWVVIERVYRGPVGWQWVAFTAALGLAQLAKGPVALAVVMLTVIAVGWLLRGASGGLGPRAWWWFGSAAAVSFGLFAAWGLPANLATGGELAQRGLGEHVFERIIRPDHGHGGSGVLGYLALVPIYIPLIIATFFPWTLLLPAAVSAMIRKHLGGPRERAILWAWIVPTFVLLSLVSTKLPHYVFPIYPALAIASAGVLVQRVAAPDRLSDKDRDWLRGGVWFFGPVAVGTAVGVPVALGVVIGAGAAVLPAAWALLAVALSGWIIYLLLHERMMPVAWTTLAGVAVVLLAGLAAVLPAVERKLKPSPELAAAARAAAGRGVEPVDFAAEGYEESSLAFYLDLPHDEVVAMGVDIAAWARRPGPGVLIVTRDRFDRAQAPLGAGERLPLEVIQSIPAVNYSSQAKRLDVLVTTRAGGRAAPIDAPIDTPIDGRSR